MIRTILLWFYLVTVHNNSESVTDYYGGPFYTVADCNKDRAEQLRIERMLNATNVDYGQCRAVAFSRAHNEGH